MTESAFRRYASAVCVLLLCLSLGACASKKTAPLPKGAVAQDLVRFPQKLDPYAAKAGGARRLIGGDSAQAAAARQKDAIYRPWRLDGPTSGTRSALRKNFWTSPRKAFTQDKQPFPMGTWNSLLENTNKGAFGRGSGPAITIKHTNLRAMPTKMHLYRRPDLPGEGYPFDYFQQSSIPPATPLYISNISKDGQWLLAESPAVAGWLPAADVARVDAEFIRRWQEPPLAAVVRDKTMVDNTVAHIGTLLPLAGSASPGFGKAHKAYFPRRGANGMATIETVDLPAGTAVAVPLDLTPDAVAKIGNVMMGQRYGWGGLDELRDCSGLARDLFAPFGIHLPRNSRRQAAVGRRVSVKGMANSQKEATILREGQPFRSLIYMPGHIGVYVGNYNGRAMMLHNVWGLRTYDQYGGCDNRAVIGKTVVTTLTPGAERKDLCEGRSLLDRIERVSILP